MHISRDEPPPLLDAAAAYEAKRALGACDHHLGALPLVISARRRRFDIDNAAFSTSIR
jgi:hypothetical protein